MTTSPLIHNLELERALFPLPLTPFERFMIAEDIPDHPMTFQIVLKFEGQLDASATRVALYETAARNPLLRSLLENRKGAMHWVALPPDRLDFELEDSCQLADGRPRRDLGAQCRSTHPIAAATRRRCFDLSCEPGFNVRLRRSTTESSLLFEFHHACCDGQGARRAIVDFCTGYARHLNIGHRIPKWDELDIRRLAQRGVYGRPRGDGSTNQQLSPWQRLVLGYRFHTFWPQPIASKHLSNEASTPDSASLSGDFESQLFSREESHLIRARSRELRVSLNDVALTLLFRVLNEWNRNFGGEQFPKRVRIMMPTDLRERADDIMPAANRIGFSFVARTADQCEDMNELFQSIQSETQYIKQLQLGIDFLNGLELALRFPKTFEFLRSRRNCMASAIFTNMGDPSRRFRRRFPEENGFPVLGNVVLKEVTGVPPLRPLTNAGFCLTGCGGAIALSLRTDPVAFSRAAASDLLQRYVAAWRNWTVRG